MSETVEPASFVDAMASGVVVLMVMADDEPLGIALPSLASYSINPPSVMASVPASIGPLLSPRFGVSLLESSQRQIGERLWRVPGPVDPVAVNDGIPHLPEALADLDCSPLVITELEHALIVVAEVTSVSIRQVRPLIFLDGGFVAA